MAPRDEYRGPGAEARAARIAETLGTDSETLIDVVWLLRYTTVRDNIQWPSLAELLEMRDG